MERWETFYLTFGSDHIRPYTVIYDSGNKETYMDILVEARRSWLTEEEIALLMILGAENLTLTGVQCRAQSNPMYQSVYDGMILKAGGCTMNHATCGIITVYFPGELDDEDFLPIPVPSPVNHLEMA